MTLRIKIARIVSALALALTASVAGAQDLELIENPEPTLKSSITVAGNLVTLGDLFNNAGKTTEIAVFRAPSLGKSGVLSSRRIMAAASQHGLKWTNPKRFESIIVARDSRNISLDQISQKIKEYLLDNHPRQMSQSELKVNFHTKATPFIVRADADTEFEIHRLNFAARTGRFTAIIAASTGTDPAKFKTYTGRALEMVEVPVLAVALARGKTIHANHIETKRVLVRRITNQILTAKSDIIGMAARRSLRPDALIRTSDLEKPRVVKKNTLVSIVYNLRKLQIVSRARALEDGALGETIMVLNQRSRRTIQAVITAPNVVTAYSNNLHKTASLIK